MLMKKSQAILCMLALHFMSVTMANPLSDMNKRVFGTPVDWAGAEMTSISVKTSSAYGNFQFVAECTPTDQERFSKTDKFFFGMALGEEPPECLFTKFELTVNGVRQQIPQIAYERFGTAIAAYPIIIRNNSKTETQLSFLGGSGGGSYYATLVFRNGKLAERAVYAFDPKIQRFRDFHDKY
jgi:hypothetical protein